MPRQTDCGQASKNTKQDDHKWISEGARLFFCPFVVCFTYHNSSGGRGSAATGDAGHVSGAGAYEK
jgi:hypothetical protein